MGKCSDDPTAPPTPFHTAYSCAKRETLQVDPARIIWAPFDLTEADVTLKIGDSRAGNIIGQQSQLA